jgi:hypothetical protein
VSDPLRPLELGYRTNAANASESEAEAACLPPEPEKCEEPSNRSVRPPAASPSTAEPAPSRRAVELLVSRARAQKRPRAPDLPSDRAGSRPLSPQAQSGVTRSGDRYADIALRRGATSSTEAAELMSATAQGGAHNEVSVTALRVQSQTSDRASSVTSDLFSAKAAVSARMLSGCDGVYVAAGATAAQIEFSHRSNEAEESSLGLLAGAGFEGGICIRDKDEDGQPETCLRIGVGPLVVTDCSEPSEPPPRDHEMGTGGGPSHYADQPRTVPRTALGAGGSPGQR